MPVCPAYNEDLKEFMNQYYKDTKIEEMVAIKQGFNIKNKCLSFGF